jgi:hypothetical protein
MSRPKSPLYNEMGRPDNDVRLEFCANEACTGSVLPRSSELAVDPRL